jgi:2-dehydro-3-deoxy-D-pentonate aldolase
MGLYTIGRSNAAIIQALKCALSLRGICGDTLAAPLGAFGAVERARVAGLLEALDSDTPAPASAAPA